MVRMQDFRMFKDLFVCFFIFYGMVVIYDEYLDVDTLYKARIINIRGKILNTPAKAVDKSITHSNEFINIINDYFKYHNFLIESHYRARKTEHLKQVSKTYNRLIDRLGNEFIYIGIVYITKDFFVNAVSRNIRNYSRILYEELISSDIDIISLPYVPHINKLKDFGNRYVKAYIEFLKNMVEHLNFSDAPVVAGILQDFGEISLFNDLIQLYVNTEKVKLIGFNFDARVPSSIYPFLQYMYREIHNLSGLGRFIYYAFNVNKGRLISSLDCIPARDVMVFGYGFDILGNKHIPTPSKERSRDYMMIFNRDRYCYDRIKFYGSIQNMYKKEKLISLKEYIMDFHNLHIWMKRGRPVKGYLKNRNCIHHVDLENISRLREDVFQQTTLLDKIQKWI